MVVTETKRRTAKKLSQQIYELLKKDIVECKLEPGQLLEENVISERYEIGRTPFREASHRLEAEGLVNIVHRRGAFVASFSYESTNDLFELRMIVEPSAAELACQRGSGAPLTALEENIAELQKLTGLGVTSLVPEIAWNSRHFHVGVGKLTGNKELSAAIESLNNKLMRLMIFAARRSPQNYPFNAAHPRILEAIKRGDTAQARSLMTRDIDEAWKWIRNFGR